MNVARRRTRSQRITALVGESNAHAICQHAIVSTVRIGLNTQIQACNARTEHNMCLCDAVNCLHMQIDLLYTGQTYRYLLIQSPTKWDA